MDPSERLSALLALTYLVQGDMLGADLLVSAFAAAVRCGRRATGELPFDNLILAAYALPPIPQPAAAYEAISV